MYEVVGSIEGVKETMKTELIGIAHHRISGERLDVQPSLGGRSIPATHDQVPAIVGHLRKEPEPRQIGALVDQFVIGAGLAQPVIEHPHVRIDRKALISVGIARVIEPKIVLRPFGVPEPHAVDHVASLLPGRHLENVHVHVVRPALSNVERHIRTVMGKKRAGYRHGAVLRVGVRIEEQFGITVQALLAIQDRLIGQTVVIAEDIRAAPVGRNRPAGKVPQPGKSFDQCGPARDAGQVASRKVRLGSYPPGDLFGLFFKPPIGVGNNRAVKVVSLVGSARCRIGKRHRGCHGRWPRKAREVDETPLPVVV